MGFSRQYSEQIYKRALEKMRRKIKIWRRKHKQQNKLKEIDHSKQQ
jgi:hypothetical protein